MSFIKVSFFVLLIGCGGNPASSADDPPSQTSSGWQLIWADEFDYQGLPDSTKWSYDVGGHGWGNNELQYYTERRLENAYVNNDRLYIQARKEQWQENAYTSARLVTRNKGDWTYGRFEIRARLPLGLGTWPAIWMLPTNWTYGDGGWPDNGEIDIMEHVGFDPGVVHTTVHTHAYNWPAGTQRGESMRVNDVGSAFHVYAIEWRPERITAFVDSTEYFTFENEGTGWQVWPFDKDFHLLLNIAVGGNWGGAQGVDPNVFPQRMEIDYVRVYKWEG